MGHRDHNRGGDRRRRRLMGLGGSSVFDNVYQYAMDGAAEYGNIDSLLTNQLAAATDFTMSGYITVADATPAATARFLSFGDTNADTRFHFSLLATTGKLRFACKEAGTFQWVLDTDAQAFADATKAHFMIVFDSVAAKLYVNNVFIAQTMIIATDQTVSFAALAGLDNGRVGCVNVNSGGNTDFLNGEMDELRVWTSALSDADRNTHFNGGIPLAPTSEPSQASLVATYTFDDPRDNYNIDVANEWRFYNTVGLDNMDTNAAEEADRVANP